MRTICVTLLAAAVAAPVCAQPPKPGATLTGGFIQYWNAYTVAPGTALTPEQWKDVVRAMAAAKMDTLVVQHLVWEQGGTDWPKNADTASFMRDKDDATQAILDEAAQRKIKVYLGLWHRELDETTLTTANLAYAKRRTTEVLTEARKRYGKHPALEGWYLPLELWNFKDLTAEQREAIRGYLGIANGIADKRVMVSLHFNPEGFATADHTASVYKGLLKGTGIDVVALQDGAGARGWAKVEPVLADYTAAFKAETESADIAMWSDVEIYAGAAEPVDPKRLADQLAHVPAGTKAIAWDFFLYMDPSHKNDPKYLGAPKAMREALYNAYLAPIH
jgi:hypothetical protein